MISLESKRIEKRDMFALFWGEHISFVIEHSEWRCLLLFLRLGAYFLCNVGEEGFD